MQGLPQKASKIAHQSEEHPDWNNTIRLVDMPKVFQHLPTWNPRQWRFTAIMMWRLQEWQGKTTQSQSCFHFRRDGTIIRMIPNLNIYIHINHNRFTGLQEWLRRISWSIWPICPCRWVALPSLSSMKTSSKKQQSWRVFKCHVWLLAGIGCIADYPVENNDVNSQVWLPKKGYVLPRLLLVSCCIQILVA